MATKAVERIKTLAKELASVGDVGHKWSPQGNCICGVSETSVSDDGVCEIALRALLQQMGRKVVGELLNTLEHEWRES